jgi:hypothetical protein
MGRTKIAAVMGGLIQTALGNLGRLGDMERLIFRSSLMKCDLKMKSM